MVEALLLSETPVSPGGPLIMWGAKLVFFLLTIRTTPLLSAVKLQTLVTAAPAISYLLSQVCLA